MTSYDSIPRDDFHNAVKKHSISCNWVTKERRNTIQVYEIAEVDNWDLHLSVMYDPTGRNVKKLHFTLRRGPGKGTDAFAWYHVIGFNRSARLGAREDRGDVSLFSNENMPTQIKQEVENIDFYIKEIFALAISYIKHKPQK